MQDAVLCVYPLEDTWPEVSKLNKGGENKDLISGSVEGSFR